MERMRKMALWQSTVIGLTGGVLLLLGMMVMSPEHVGIFFNVPGLLMVIGGTLAATIVSRPIHEVRAVVRLIPRIAAR